MKSAGITSTSSLTGPVSYSQIGRRVSTFEGHRSVKTTYTRPLSTMTKQYLNADRPTFDDTSREELLSQIALLKSKLDAITVNGDPRSSGQEKKRTVAFDSSKYATRRIALKFSYLGQSFNGLEHANGCFYPMPTVEEVIWKALRKTKLINPPIPEGADSTTDVVWDQGKREALYGPNGDRRMDVLWDNCEYSKCGRTDRGVSAFGQVIGVRVRSSKPEDDGREWDSISNELPYITMLNSILPPTIRILAWSPHPHDSFDARFSCLERRYKYFFTNPACCPLPGPLGLMDPERTSSASDGPELGHLRDGWLDVDAMSTAAKKLEGLHDFRNLCKIDPSKQMANCLRRITHASITEHESDPSLLTNHPHMRQFSRLNTSQQHPSSSQPSTVKTYTLNLHGTAFLWHQVRCIAAVLFLVGQRLERPEIIDSLLDINQTPSRPDYGMASDAPLVLWDCVFPGDDPDVDKAYADRVGDNDGRYPERVGGTGMNWIYAGDKTTLPALSTKGDMFFGHGGLVETLWTQYRAATIQQAQIGGLLRMVLEQGDGSAFERGGLRELVTDSSGIGRYMARKSTRVFEGSDQPRLAGRYVPLLQRRRMDSLQVQNEKYAATAKGRAWTAAHRTEQGVQVS